VIVVVTLIDWRNVSFSPQVASIDRFHVACELWIFALIAVDCELCFGDLQAETLTTRIAATGGQHELCIRRIEILAQRLDEVHEVLLVATGHCGALVFVTLLTSEFRLA